MSDPTPVRRKALVTGGATGIGRSAVLALARAGFDVALVYASSAAAAQATAAEAQAAGAEVLLLRCDVADDAAVRATLARVDAAWGRLDALVNNAGITSFAGTGNWDALDAETFHHILGVNVVGMFQMVRACAPHLTAAGGAIVNVSSIAGALGIGSSVAYIASKGAVNSLTLHLARTMAPAVRVNAVCPGLITTRWFVDGVGTEAYEKILATYEQTAPLGRACSAEDVAEAVLWLVDGARTVTGELVLLDSGMHLGRAVTTPQRGR